MKKLKRALENEDIAVLNIVHGKPGATFSGIVRLKHSNKDRIRDRLEFLIEKKYLVYVEGDWKRGRAKHYLITEEGRLFLLKKNVEGLRELLGRVKTLSSEMLARSDNVQELGETGRRAVRDAAGPRGLTLEQAAGRLEEMFREKHEDLALETRIQKVMETDEEYFGDFRRALWNMHQISLDLLNSKTRLRLLGEAYLHVTSSGLIEAVSELELLQRLPGDMIISF